MKPNKERARNEHSSSSSAQKSNHKCDIQRDIELMLYNN